MRSKLQIFLIFIVMSFMAASVLAQPPMPLPGRRGPGMGPEGGPGRERLRERIATMKIWKLTEAVGLTSEQSEKFFPLYNKHQKAIEKIEDSRLDLIDRLDSLATDSTSSNQKINDLFGQLQDIPQQIASERSRFMKDISPILSVKQQAKLMVFEERFRQRLQEFIRDIRQEYGGGRMGDEPREEKH